MTDLIPYAEMEETLGFEGPYRDPPQAKRTPVVRLVVLSLCAIVLITVALIGSMATTRPAWWPARSSDTEWAQQKARDIENAATQFATAVRGPNESWSVLLKEEDANTWLEARLHAWVEATRSPWPTELGRVAVRFEDRRVVVGVEVMGEGAHGEGAVASFVFEPRIGVDQLARMEVREVRFNRLPIPRSIAERRLTEALAKALQRDQAELVPLLLAMRGEAIPEPPVLPLDDGRRVHLVGIEARDGALVLHCETRTPTQTSNRDARLP